MHLGTPYHRIESGRIFIRAASPQSRNYHSPQWDATSAELKKNGALLVGVVEVPKSADVERIHIVRLNDALWMDVDTASKAPDCYFDLRESSVTDVLTSIGWRRHLLPDTFDVFLRATAMPHQDSQRRWAFVVAVLAHRPAALPKDGLYEFDTRDGFRHVDGNTFNGDGLQSVVRAPMWGPGGKFGFSHSLEPQLYPKWLEQERKRNTDPMFKRFLEVMEAEMPLPLYYDAEYEEARERLTKQVIRRLVSERDAAEDAAIAVAPATASRRLRP